MAASAAQKSKNILAARRAAGAEPPEGGAALSYPKIPLFSLKALAHAYLFFQAVKLGAVHAGKGEY